MNTVLTMVKREFWEHKGAFVYTPAALALLIVLLMVVGAIAVNSQSVEINIADDHSFNVEAQDKSERHTIILFGDGEATALAESDSESEIKRFFADNRETLDMGLHGIHMIFLMIVWSVLPFYLLNTLYADRRDNSILFWKSLPISETQSVLVKLGVALLIVPLFATLVSWLVQLVYVVMAIVVTALLGEDPWLVITPNLHIISAFVGQLGLVLMISLWVLPICAWLLLASAGAKRSPFLVASLPIVAFIAIEGALFQTSYVVNLIAEYFTMAEMYLDNLYENAGLYSLIPSMGISISLGLGAAFAAIFVTAAIWLRNHRFEL